MRCDIGSQLHDKEKQGIDATMDQDVTKACHAEGETVEEDNGLFKPQQTRKIEGGKKPKADKDNEPQFGDENVADIKIRKGDLQEILGGIGHPPYIIGALGSCQTSDDRT